MASTGLPGPYVLTRATIAFVLARAAPGAYALGAMNSGGGLDVSRIGRSDTDLPRRLADYVGQYTHFRAGYCSSPKAAFEKECHLYHDFDPPDNAMHPDRPAGTTWVCPRCLIFD